MSIFEAEKTKPLSHGGWASIYIKWNDDRGRGFEDVISFYEEPEWIEMVFVDSKIRIRKEGIRWIEFFETKPEYNE